MQGSVVEAMERSNNPARMQMALREQVEARVSEAKEEWQLQWESERKRFNTEIERLKKAALPGVADEKKEAARRAVLERLGKLPTGSVGPAAKTAGQWEREFQDAKIEWDTEREQLNLKIKKLDMDLQRAQDSIRTEIFQEMRMQYEPKLVEANRERQRLEEEIKTLTNDIAGERQRLSARIEQLEQAIPEAQEAARKQALAELQGQFDAKVEEANRLRSRTERNIRTSWKSWNPSGGAPRNR